MADEKPEPIYATREGEVDGHFAVMIVNHALKEYRYKSDYPWHLAIDISLDDELPDEHEAAILNQLEDELHAEVMSVCSAQFIGRTTNNWHRELHYYLDRPRHAHSALTAYTQKGSPKDFEYEIREDPEWSDVEYFFDYD